jgi:hypothetical protein
MDYYRVRLDNGSKIFNVTVDAFVYVEPRSGTNYDNSARVEINIPTRGQTDASNHIISSTAPSDELNQAVTVFKVQPGDQIELDTSGTTSVDLFVMELGRIA